jgi:hypothetical protein
MIFAPLAVELSLSAMHLPDTALSNGLAGGSQFWLSPVLHVQMSSCLPLVVLE